MAQIAETDALIREQQALLERLQGKDKFKIMEPRPPLHSLAVLAT